MRRTLPLILCLCLLPSLALASFPGMFTNRLQPDMTLKFTKGKKVDVAKVSNFKRLKKTPAICKKDIAFAPNSTNHKGVNFVACVARKSASKVQKEITIRVIYMPTRKRYRQQVVHTFASTQKIPAQIQYDKKGRPIKVTLVGAKMTLPHRPNVPSFLGSSSDVPLLLDGAIKLVW